MRDLVLAEQFSSKGHQITFACLPLEGNAISKIKDKKYAVIELEDGSKEELVEWIKSQHIDLLIIDHYQIEKPEELYIRQQTNTLVFIVDDLYKEHDCDFILNHNISGNKDRYEGKIPKDCIVMAGPQYALIRKEFRNAVIAPREVDSTQSIPVFITFGGSDPTNLSELVIDHLKKFPNLLLHIFTTTSNSHLESLKNKVNSHKNVVLHINEADLASKMKTCAFALVSPSVTCLEAIFMELPLIAIQAVSNTQNTFNYLKKHDLFALEVAEIDTLEKYIRQLLEPDFYDSYYQYTKQIKDQNFNTQNNSIYELVITRANGKTEEVRNHHDS